ncbi:MAG: sulfurtransferase TusA family protein [Caulobacteraceae bacterium]
MIIDARSHRCPIPTLRLQKALAGVQPGDTVVLLADDPMARIDVPHFAAGQGHLVLSVTQAAETLRITVQKGAGHL